MNFFKTNEQLDALEGKLKQSKPLRSVGRVRYAQSFFGVARPQALIDDLQDLPNKILEDSFDGGTLLREGWEYSSSYLFDLWGKDLILTMLEYVGPVALSGDHWEYVEQLPDEISVFRGGDAIENADDKMSWTNTLSSAEFHANSEGREGYVVEGVANKRDLLAFFPTESELVFRPGAVAVIKKFAV